MPEVGVLNLTIHDNSETAAEGLNHLTDALVSIQSAIGNGLKLSGVSGPLNKFANAVSANSKTFASVGTFLNAMKEYQRAFKDAENVKFNAQPIKDLKEAIDDGIKIGNAGTQINKIKEALGGGWDTAQSANIKTVLQDIAEGSKSFQGTNLGTTAKNVSATAKALSEYAEASRQIKDVLGTSQNRTLEDMANTPSRLKLNLQLHGGNGDFEHIASSVQNITQPYKEFASTIQTTGNIARDAELDKYISSPIESLQQKYKDLASGAVSYNNALNVSVPKIQQVSAESVVAQKNIQMLMDKLNTPVKYNGFSGVVNQISGIGRVLLNAKEYAKVFESIPSDKFEEMVTLASNVQEETKIVHAYTDAANEGLAASARLNKEIAEKYKDKPAETFEDIFFGTREKEMGKTPLMSNWLNGMGTAHEQQYAIEEMAKRFSMSVDEVKQKIAELSGAFNEAKTDTSKIDDMLGMGKVELMSQQYDAMKQSIADAYTAGNLTDEQFLKQIIHLQEYGERLAAAKDEQERLAGSSFSLEGALRSLGGGIQRMFPQITNLVKRFKGMAIMRTMRYLIRQISAGFREGVQNVYGYSKAIGGSFAPAMDSAATALQQMKNSLGAALAPALQAIIPYVNQLVSWFINLINYVNQFFALLNGQSSWTRALPATAQAFDKQTKAAKGASAAMKDLLADWDELNIIQKESGGGSGTGSAKTAEDYLKMFEEVNRFDSKVRKITDYINSHVSQLLSDVYAIGAAILGWKISTAFKDVLGVIGSLLGGAAMAYLTFDITTQFDKQFLETGEDGWLIGSFLTPLIGGYFMSKILKTTLGGGVAKIGIPLAFTVSGIADIVTIIGRNDTSAIDPDNLKLTAISSLKAGVAASYLAYKAAGISLGKSLAGGAAVSLATFGAIVGIKTTVEAVKSGVTEDTIKGVAISSLLMGAGVGLLTKLSGASLAGALGLGAVATGATLLTLTAAIGIGILLTRDKTQTIKWGDYEATEQEIRNFIGANGFTADVPATLTLVKNTIDILPSERKQIESDAAALIPTLQVIKYGLATEETYEQLKLDLFGEDGEGGAIGRIKDYAKEQKTLIQTSFTLMPIVDSAGEVDEKATVEMMKEGTTGWDEVNRYMSEIGTSLAEALKGSTIDGIKTFDDELIYELTQKITNVQRAMSQANTSSAAVGELMSDLSGLNKDSFDTSIDIWNDYRSQLKESYEKTLKEELVSYRTLAAFYATRGNAGDDILAQKYTDLADGLVATWGDRLNHAVDEMSDPGREILRESILKLIDVNISNMDIASAFYGKGYTASDMWSDFFGTLFDANGKIDDMSNEMFGSFLDDILRSAFGNNYDTIKKLIDSGVLGYGDLIDKDLIQGIANQFFENSGTDEMRKAWVEFFNSYFGENSITIDELPKVQMPENYDISEEVMNEIIGNRAAEAVAIGVPIDIEIIATRIKLTDDLEEELRGKIQDALSDGVMDFLELDNLNATYGSYNVRQVLQKMWDEGMNPDGTFGKIPAGMRIASTGINYGPNNVPVNYAPSGENNTIVTEPKDPQQEISNTASGVERGNRNLEGLMRDLLAAMNRVGDRPITVSLFPSSGWGNTNRQSEKKMEEVTGYSG